MKTTLSGQVTGVHLPPNVAFVLVDGALNSPFSGNLVWALEATESMLPQDMTVVTGSIAWHSGQQRTYVVLSHSGGSWVRLGVYQTDLKPLGPYTPLSPPAASQGILGPNRSDAKPFATWESNNLSSHGLFEVNAVQTLVEPESLVIHLVDANTLKRINTVNPTHYQGELDLKLGLINGVWSNITRRTGPPLEPVTARGVLSRGQGKAGDLWTLTLDHPIYVRNPDAGESAAGVEVKLLRFVGGRKGPQDSHYAGKHVELSGTLVSPASPGVAGVKVQTITVLE
ncbi:MAG TPA: hypothetical protein VG204_04430 [Terriglobia bacterium]|nr:hypothetical protein [Terriglobia bacterium]